MQIQEIKLVQYMFSQLLCHLSMSYYHRPRATIELQDPRGSIDATIIGESAEKFLQRSALTLLNQITMVPIQHTFFNYYTITYSFTFLIQC